MKAFRGLIGSALVALSMPVWAQDDKLSICAEDLAKNLRTNEMNYSSEALITFSYDYYCRESKSFESLNSIKKTAFSGVYNEINRFGFGSDNQQATVAETYDAFCSRDESTFSADRRQYREVSTIHDNALRIVEMCVVSARAGVVTRYAPPADPRDNVTVLFKSSSAHFLNGVTTRNANCFIGGEQLSARLSSPKKITSESIIVTCTRESSPIMIYGLSGDYFPRAQITFDTNYADAPFDIVLAEELRGPLQDRLTAIEAAQVPQGAVLAFDLQTGCPEGWSSFVLAEGRTVIGTSQAYKLRAVGGQEAHTLTPEEMPSHSHGGATGGGGGAMVYDGSAASGKFGSGGHGFSAPAHEHPISAQGADKPHNNMQPYVVLVYCRKS